MGEKPKQTRTPSKETLERRAARAAKAAELTTLYEEFRAEEIEADEMIRVAMQQRIGRLRLEFMEKMAEMVKETTAADVSRALGVTRQTVYRWVQEIEDTKKVDQ